MKLILSLFSVFVLSACSGSQSRLISFICENDPGKRKIWSKTLDNLQKDLDYFESLAAFHAEWMPWVFDKKTGQLYEYSSLQEAFVPRFNSNIRVNTYGIEWEDFRGQLFSDGKKMKITTLTMSKNVLLGDSILREDVDVYNIEEQKIELFRDGKKVESSKCILAPVEGIDILG